MKLSQSGFLFGGALLAVGVVSLIIYISKRNKNNDEQTVKMKLQGQRPTTVPSQHALRNPVNSHFVTHNPDFSAPVSGEDYVSQKFNHVGDEQLENNRRSKITKDTYFQPRTGRDTRSTCGDMYQRNGEEANLMPAKWRKNDAQGFDDSVDKWARYAPTKKAHKNYIQAAGIMRLRTPGYGHKPLGRLIGSDPFIGLRPPVKTPISTGEVMFNDSHYRQDAIYNHTGLYPDSVSC